MDTTNRSRKVTVRFTTDEFRTIEKQFKNSTRKYISDYIRDYLLEGKITLYYRNKSLDDFMEEMKLLRRELSAIGNNFNQVVKKLNSTKVPPEVNFWMDMAALLQKQLLEKTEVIKNKIGQISDIWLQGS